MNKALKNKLEMLRQRFPIGLQHGQSLLEKADGDLEKADAHFQDEMVTLTMDKAGVTRGIAIRHLAQNKFDIDLTIKSIEEERSTLTAIILTRYRNNKEEALDKVMQAVERTEAIERKIWLDFKDLKRLHEDVFCFITITEWLNYERHEHLNKALSFELEIVTEQLEHKLHLPELASALLRAREIQQATYKQNESSKGIAHYIKATNQLQEDKEFQKCEDILQKQRPLLIEQLYERITANIEQFP